MLKCLIWGNGRAFYQYLNYIVENIKNSRMKDLGET